jgi:hypothetical protein
MIAEGPARGLMRLRDLRDTANSAIILGADGDGNVCRQLMRVVNERTDPRLGSPQHGEHGEIDRRLAAIATEALSLCDRFRAVIQAQRIAR